MSDEWGPWIKHDGKGCPCIGQYCHMVYVDNHARFCIAEGSASWIWKSLKPSGWGSDPDAVCVPIVRYRIRKPRAMMIFEKILARIPDLVDAN